MKAPAPRNISQRIVYRYSALTVTCFVGAMLQALAVGLTVALVTSFRYEQFGLARLLWFVPSHEFLWRAWCVAYSLSALGLLLIAVNWSQLVARRFRETAQFSTLLIAISSYAAIDAYLMMMTQFSDLARDANYNFSVNQLGTMQLSAVTVTQFLTRLMLLSNSLECIAGIILSICGFLTPKFPRAVAWLGLIIWLIAINATITAACGQTDLAVKIYYGSRALLIALFTTFGSVCTLRAADKSAGSLNKVTTGAEPASPPLQEAQASTNETSAPVDSSPTEGEPEELAGVDATTATDWRAT
ncbi:MAG: hypothetical protein K2W95_08625 [Candidatus Obscuribacterales bacterium]|nr:hypothetical protein [Candidatus Obscuribacterales bacterium]